VSGLAGVVQRLQQVQPAGCHVEAGTLDLVLGNSLHGLARGPHKAPCYVQQSVNEAGAGSVMSCRLVRSTRCHVGA
jgi:hypothetical protein